MQMDAPMFRHVAIDGRGDPHLDQSKVSDQGPGKIPHPENFLAEFLVDQAGHDKPSDEKNHLGTPRVQNVRNQV